MLKTFLAKRNIIKARNNDHETETGNMIRIYDTDFY